MEKQKSLKLNFIMNAILTMSGFIFPLITFPYVSRVLKPAGTGRVSFASSVISYFALFAQLGIPTYGIRACANVRDNREELTVTVHELFIINLIMDVIVYAGLAAAVILVPRLADERTLILIMSLSVIFNTIGMEWLYQALEQYTYIAVRSIIFKAISVAGMFLLVKSESDYVIYGAITIFASSASAVFNFIHAGKAISFKPRRTYSFRRHLKPVFIFFAMSCATTIYTNLDTAMLGFMKPYTDVGYYNAAVMIKRVLVSIVTSLGVVLLPRSSYYVEHGLMDEFKDITKKAVNFVFLAAVPMMVYFIIFAREGIYFLSGSAYEGAVVPMQIIMPTLLLIGLTNIMGIQVLVPLGKEKTVLYSEIAGAVIDLILNMLLIPSFSSAGAAIGTLCAELAVWIVQFAALKSEAAEDYKSVRYITVAAAVIIACVLSVWVKGTSAGYFLKLMVSALIFFGAYGAVLIIAREPFITGLLGEALLKLKGWIKMRR